MKKLMKTTELALSYTGKSAKEEKAIVWSLKPLVALFFACVFTWQVHFSLRLLPDSSCVCRNCEYTSSQRILSISAESVMDSNMTEISSVFQRHGEMRVLGNVKMWQFLHLISKTNYLFWSSNSQYKIIISITLCHRYIDTIMCITTLFCCQKYSLANSSKLATVKNVRK